MVVLAKVFYIKNMGIRVVVCTDADWENSLSDRRSTLVM